MLSFLGLDPRVTESEKKYFLHIKSVTLWTECFNTHREYAVTNSERNPRGQISGTEALHGAPGCSKWTTSFDT